MIADHGDWNGKMGDQVLANIIYLACPYTHPSAEVRLQRFELATRAAAKLISEGLIVFSPITMSHPIDMQLAGKHNTLAANFGFGLTSRSCISAVKWQFYAWRDGRLALV